MKIFLSYASAQRPLAERINHVLLSEGHDVFFDRDDLPAAETYGERIRTAAQRCQIFVFLVAPDSVTPGSYALTELAFVENLPARGMPAIIPVLAAPLADMALLPPFLAPLTLLEPRGDAAAEVAAKVAGIAQARRRRWMLGTAAALAAGVAAGGAWWVLREGAPPAPAPVTAPPVAKPAPVPQAQRVRLVGMPGNSGWLVSFDIADPQVREIFYALEDGQPLVSSGFQAHRHPATGLPLPQMQVTLPGALGQPRQVSVKYTDGAGREHGPYRVQFNPQSEYVRYSKSVLGMTPWLSFNTAAAGRPLVYFTQLISYKNAFREIRYSVDDDSLSLKLPFSADWSGRGAPAIGAGDVTNAELPPATKFVAVKLYFIDGSESELKRFHLREPGIGQK
jgi:hypothetical protein